MSRLTLFLDDGGVLNDNSLRGPQWQRMVAEYFSPILGGNPQDWASANHKVIVSMLQSSAWQARLQAARDYEDFERNYYIDWLGSMCDIIGVPRPSEQEMIDLSRDATKTILPRVRAGISGASETVRALHASGYPLYTASGGSSTELAAHLGGLGIAELFIRLYGTDLAGAFKSGPEFYRRILADSGVAPSEAVVVDDNAGALAWASSVGLRCVQVGSAAENGNPGITHIRTITDLPALLQALE